MSKFLYFFVIAITPIIVGCSESRRRSENKQRDPIAMEWREKLLEISRASLRYREALESENQKKYGIMEKRIFPERISDLYQWRSAQNNKYLLNRSDWIEIEREITVFYYTYEEIEKDVLKTRDVLSGDAELIRKDVVGVDSSSYRISLYLSGIVTIKRPLE